MTYFSFVNDVFFICFEVKKLLANQPTVLNLGYIFSTFDLNEAVLAELRRFGVFSA